MKPKSDVVGKLKDLGGTRGTYNKCLISCIFPLSFLYLQNMGGEGVPPPLPLAPLMATALHPESDKGTYINR